MSIEIKGLDPSAGVVGRRKRITASGVGTGALGRGDASPLQTTIGKGNNLQITSALGQADIPALVTDALVKIDNLNTNTAIAFDKINYQNEAGKFTENQFMQDKAFIEGLIEKSENNDINLDTPTIDKEIKEHIDNEIEYYQGQNNSFTDRYKGDFYSNLELRESSMKNKLYDFVKNVASVRISNSVIEISNAVTIDDTGSGLIKIEGIEYKDKLLGTNAINNKIKRTIENAKALGEPITYVTQGKEYIFLNLDNAEKFMNYDKVVKVETTFDETDKYKFLKGNQVTSYVDYNKLQKAINEGQKFTPEDKRLHNEIITLYKEHQQLQIDADNSNVFTEYLENIDSPDMTIGKAKEVARNKAFF